MANHNVAPTILVKAPLVLPEDIKVTHDGENVRLQVGDAWLDMHYEGALKISQMLRLHAKLAKAKAGDVSRHWSAVAALEGIGER